MPRPYTGLALNIAARLGVLFFQRELQVGEDLALPGPLQELRLVRVRLRVRLRVGVRVRIECRGAGRRARHAVG